MVNLFIMIIQIILDTMIFLLISHHKCSQIVVMDIQKYVFNNYHSIHQDNASDAKPSKNT